MYEAPRIRFSKDDWFKDLSFFHTVNRLSEYDSVIKKKKKKERCTKHGKGKIGPNI